MNAPTKYDREPRGASDAAPATVVARLRRTFDSRRTRPYAWRKKQLTAIENMLRDHEGEICDAIAHDLGRSPHETWIGDLAPTATEAAYARKHLRGWMRRRRARLPLVLQPGRAYTTCEPLGLVLVIGAWNYPVYLTLGPVIGALAAGNAVIVKPSEHAPASSALLARLLPLVLDPDAVAVLEGDGAVIGDVIAEGVDHVFFTGGAEIGQRVMETAARQLVPVTLELGGKSPVIVAADADLTVAAKRIAMVKLMNSGQTCIAPDYVLVVDAVKDAFLAELVTALKTMQADQVTAQKIVNERHHARLVGLLDGHGGRIVTGGRAVSERIAIEPTVIVDPDPSSELMTTEIFGPLLPVLTVPDVGSAVSFVNARPKPLALYLFSNSTRCHDFVVDHTSSGGVVINHVAIHGGVPTLPFGGIGHSGIGSYHGQYGFERLSHRKAVVSKRAKPDVSLQYPPYSPRQIAIMRRLS